MGSFGYRSVVSHGRRHGVSTFVRCKVITNIRTVRSSNLRVARRGTAHVNTTVNSKVNNLKLVRRGRASLVGNNPHGVDPFFIPSAVIGVITNRLAVVCNLHNPDVSVTATYASNIRGVNRTTHVVTCNSTSIVITNNTRGTDAPLNINNFNTTHTLSAHGSGPRTTDHP